MNDDDFDYEDCPTCNGSGEDPIGFEGLCFRCGGSGEVRVEYTEPEEDDE